MKDEEIKEAYQIEQERNKAYKDGYSDGIGYKNRTMERNKTLETALLEFIGYEKEWLRTKVGYNKLNNKELILIVLEQRELLKLLFEKLDDSEKDRLKNQVEKVIWKNNP